NPFNPRQITSLPAILRPNFPHCNPTTISCSAFLLTPKPFRRKIPAIAVHFAAQGEPRTGEGGHRRTTLCNIFPAGPCNASTRTVPPAVIGFAPIFPAPTLGSNSALAAAARFKPFRRRSARVSACARAPSPRVRPCVRVLANVSYGFGSYINYL